LLSQFNYNNVLKGHKTPFNSFIYKYIVLVVYIAFLYTHFDAVVRAGRRTGKCLTFLLDNSNKHYQILGKFEHKVANHYTLAGIAF